MYMYIHLHLSSAVLLDPQQARAREIIHVMTFELSFNSWHTFELCTPHARAGKEERDRPRPGEREAYSTSWFSNTIGQFYYLHLPDPFCVPAHAQCAYVPEFLYHP